MQRPSNRFYRVSSVKSAVPISFLSVFGLVCLLFGVVRLSNAAMAPATLDTAPYLLVGYVDEAYIEPSDRFNYTIEWTNLSGPEDIWIQVEYSDGLSFSSLVAGASHITDLRQEIHRFSFKAQVDPGQTEKITFRMRSFDDVPCGVLEALVRIRRQGDTEDLIEPAKIHSHMLCTDVGDAPDSTNHFGVAMSAYPSVTANFPTVYHSHPTEPVGPRHFDAQTIKLGRGVFRNDDADVGNTSHIYGYNLLPTLDIADRDVWDDGLGDLLPQFEHCEYATFAVAVTAQSYAVDLISHAYINVWYDGNHDGDWEDMVQCNDNQASEGGVAIEHIVIDQQIEVSSNQNSHVIFTTMPVLKESDDEGWLRITLSEQPSVKTNEIDGVFFGDGRGVLTTVIDEDGTEVRGFQYGETEDYLIRKPSLLEMNREISKIASSEYVGNFQRLTYTITVRNGYGEDRPVTIVDDFAYGLEYIEGSLHSSRPGLESRYDPLSRSIYWRGDVPADGQVDISFKGNLPRCRTYRDHDSEADRPALLIDHHSGLIRLGFLTTAISNAEDCTDPFTQVLLQKTVEPLTAVGGGLVSYTLTARNTFTNLANLNIKDHLPFGVSVDPSQLPPELTYVEPNKVVWDIPNPAVGTISVTFPAQAGFVPCGGDVVNYVTWDAVSDQQSVSAGFGNQVITPVDCSILGDMGDAPDSSNHLDLTNTAYTATGVVGHFPTTWEPTTGDDGPRGPFHGREEPGAILGLQRSVELDADLEPDYDEATNILDDEMDRANMDSYDDGWLNSQIVFEHCLTTTLQVRVSPSPSLTETIFLNVWFDSNRDGDWEDTFDCTDSDFPAGQEVPSDEWIVQNYEVDIAALVPGQSIDLQVPTSLISNAHPEQPGWIRFTLSEQHAPANPDSGLPDGRGLAYPNFYAIGETEDYLTWAITIVEPPHDFPVYLPSITIAP